MANDKQQELVHVSQVLLGANDKGGVVYHVNGEEVKLSFNIVRRFLTRGSTEISDAEVIQFISICKANCLNPFIGDCYLIKYEGRGPASMVTSRDAFMRRAESATEVYQGFESGIIVIRGDEVLELPGSFFIPSKEQLVGGWAKVYRSDRKVPTYQRVSLQEYNSGKSNWASKPGTMIQKVAEAQAFRKAFPKQMGGLYTPEEMPDDQRPAEEQAEQKVVPVFKAVDEQPIDREAPDPAPDPEPAPPLDEEQRLEPHQEALRKLMEKDEDNGEDAPEGLFKL